MKLMLILYVPWRAYSVNIIGLNCQLGRLGCTSLMKYHDQYVPKKDFFFNIRGNGFFKFYITVFLFL